MTIKATITNDISHHLLATNRKQQKPTKNVQPNIQLMMHACTTNPPSCESTNEQIVNSYLLVPHTLISVPKSIFKSYSTQLLNK